MKGGALDHKNPARKEETSGEAGASVVGGLNAVLAALKARSKSCRSLMTAEGRRHGPTVDEIFFLAREAGLSVKKVPRQALDRLYGAENHQGLVAVFDAVDYTSFDDFLPVAAGASPSLALALDQVEDPGNLGALMRSASAFGAIGVIVPRERTAPLTSAAVKASAGAAESLPLIRVVNLRRALETLRDYGFWIVGAEGGEGENVFDFAFPDKTALVMGSEGRGLSPTVKKVCDFLVSIPHEVSQVNSLNVSVAGGIMMAQYYRRFRAGEKITCLRTNS